MAYVVQRWLRTAEVTARTVWVSQHIHPIVLEILHIRDTNQLCYSFPKFAVAFD
jgi:hypothetical protein